MRKVNTTIKYIEPYSIAEDAGIEVGDKLISINGHDFHDILEYRYLTAEYEVTLEILKKDGTTEVITVENDYDDIGIEFEEGLIDEAQSCRNKCIFCFIDQNPPGMRESIYCKDDDSRLSFLHGNYITLTNLRDHDIERIIEMHMSPVNVSVHTTNPELRRMMMHNKRAGEVLGYLRRLADGGIKLRGQIVLCRNVNDGAELDRTMRDLYGLYPAMDSVSVVPAGMTAYRKGLYPLENFTDEECAGVVRQVTSFADGCERDCGERIFYPSDEFYLRGKVEFPPYETWGEFSQIENGVGMIASFDHELGCALEMLDDNDRESVRDVSVATGEAAYDFICSMAGRISRECPSVKIRVFEIKNNFFGGGVTVTGLLTGQDLYEQLKDEELGDELILSSSMLRSEGDMFLDSSTPEELSEKLGIKISFSDNDGASFLFSILGES